MSLPAGAAPLQVPYAEKDQARALGARWDPDGKRWYVPAGRSLEPFEKWTFPDPEKMPF
jgi:hypothetical protein